jgi:hypothetical protein
VVDIFMQPVTDFGESWITRRLPSRFFTRAKIPTGRYEIRLAGYVRRLRTIERCRKRVSQSKRPWRCGR